MAIGDAAAAANYDLVPETGENGRVRWGAREINRTRDYIAQVKDSIPEGKPEYRSKVGITISTGNPSGGVNGDIHFKVL